MAESVDVFGNVDSYFHVTSSHTRLSVTGTSLVEVTRPVLDDAVLARPWEGSRPVPRSEPAAIEFVLSSPMIDTPPEVLAYARESFTDGRAIGEAVLDLTHRIHRDFAYDAKATTISTRVADVLAVKAGVCQDFAHLSIACLRSVGLAGRYTSGYLATYPPPGRERIVGADASHAWASVRLSDGSWLAFDPTNDHLTDERYTTVAWGRDYGDVPPLRGIIFTDAQERTMKVSSGRRAPSETREPAALFRPAVTRGYHHGARLQLSQLRPATGLRELRLPQLREQPRVRSRRSGLRGPRSGHGSSVAT